ncbi:MAG: coproporphyrinogen oxidase [Caulobacteraceae bacterium]|nr:coproporphyrinogen oxidase [Caulobacteraceae bacterium]
MSESSPPLGVYVHWPYCARICPYCDFTVVRDRGRAAEQAALGEAILRDLEAQRALSGPRQLVSVFFGGGTPSRMPPELVGRIIEAATRLWSPTDDLEVALEANPGDAARFADLRTAGIERLSLGLQSLNDESLAFLGRDHDAATGRSAIQAAVELFPRVSLDLIYALPGQEVTTWRRELAQAVDLGVGHVSAYQLTIEEGTAFGRARRRGTLPDIDPDLAADLFEATGKVLGAAGFEAYEVSNHAQGEAQRSRHNLVYWRGWDYAAAGPGAHGRLTRDGARHAFAAPERIADYMAANGAPVLEAYDPQEAAQERLVMGLRTLEGVGLDELSALSLPAERLEDLRELGLVTIEDGRLIATSAGRLVLDSLTKHLALG